MTLLAGQSLPATPPASDPDTIVVTGERIQRSVRETASSVAVVGWREIEASSADRIEQVLDLIPNVQVSSGGEGPTIRGQDTTGAARDLPSFLGGSRPRMTLIVDGRAVSFNELVFGITPVWDVARIEVFRTPQSTTQGRNSIAGAIFVTTQDPSFTSEYRARAIVGSEHTRQVSAVAGGALIPGELAWRVAGDLRYSRTSSRLADRARGADPNHDVYGLARIKLLARPANLPGAQIRFNYTHSQSQMPQVEGVRPPFEARRDPLASYGTFRTRIDSATLNVSYAPSDKLTVEAVGTGGDSRVQRFAPPGLGETRIGSRDWSGEAITHWSPSPAASVIMGVSHYGSSLRQFIDLSQLSGEGHFRDRQASTGLFGEATLQVAPLVKLTAGLRYQRDGQRRSGTLGTRGAAIPLDYDRTFDAWLPKLSLAFEPKPAISAGLLVQRAYNAGGTTLRFDTGAPDNFDAEYLWDYELFARASAFQDRLQLSANLFYYDQRDAQRAQPIAIIAPTGAIVTFADLFNVPRARSYGFEASAEWRPSARLTGRLGVGLLRTRIVDAGAAAAFTGKQFQRSPKLTLSAAIDWRPVQRLLLSAQLRRNSGFFSDDLNSATRYVGGWTKVDARAEWSAGKFRLFGYVRNVTDNLYLTYKFLPDFATAGDPREAGVGIEAAF